MLSGDPRPNGFFYSRTLNREMNWYLLTRRDIAAILLVSALLAGMFFLYVVFPNLNWSSISNQGFGPGWECSNPGMGDSVCIKKPPAK
jgi:hypothetical protein